MKLSQVAIALLCVSAAACGGGDIDCLDGSECRETAQEVTTITVYRVEWTRVWPAGQVTTFHLYTGTPSGLRQIKTQLGSTPGVLQPLDKIETITISATSTQVAGLLNKEGNLCINPTPYGQYEDQCPNN